MSDDSNRIVIAVTGANSGLGYGYCQRLLRQLSTAPPAAPPDTRLHPRNVPQPTVGADSRFSNADVVRSPPTLTLIMACRSRSKAEQAIASLLHEHDLGLTGRRVRGERERPGWQAGLRIVYEELDVDKVNGKGGVLDFAGRIRNNYPHLTTLVLNAGMGAFSALSWPGAARQFFTDIVGCVSTPDYIIQEAGKLSADGRRGGVWGVNVLSAYILAQELRSHLLRSPASLPLQPRIIYVSSSRAAPEFLPQPDPTCDPQLLTTVESYDASKYVGDLVVSELDREFAGGSKRDEKNAHEARSVRCVVVDPGVVWTSLFTPFLPWILEMCMVAAFFLARWIGSTVHTIFPVTAAAALSYLTLVDDAALPAPSPSTAPAKYQANADRLGRPYVVRHEVKEWQKYRSAAPALVAECERVYRESLSEPAQVGERKIPGEGVKTS